MKPDVARTLLSAASTLVSTLFGVYELGAERVFDAVSMGPNWVPTKNARKLCLSDVARTLVSTLFGAHDLGAKRVFDAVSMGPNWVPTENARKLYLSDVARTLLSAASTLVSTLFGVYELGAERVFEAVSMGPGWGPTKNARKLCLSDVARTLLSAASTLVSTLFGAHDLGAKRVFDAVSMGPNWGPTKNARKLCLSDVARTLLSAASTLMSTLFGAHDLGAKRVFDAAASRLVSTLLLPALVLGISPLNAAVTGTVINRTTGKPQPGATVGFNNLGQNGIELIDQAKSDAQGHFTINQEVRGPHLLRTAFDGVTYNHMLPPGSPTTDLTIDVYNSSKEPGGAKVSKHMLLFEPAAGQMVVNETYIYGNNGKTAWDDSDRGTLHFYAPNVSGKVTVTATAPGGMPIPAPVNKTAQPDVYAVAFPVKPGDTRFDLTYSVPYTEGASYQGKVLTQDGDTYLIAPNGITLQGAGLKDMGTEPRTQAHIYGLTGSSYQIQLTGTEAAPPAEAAAGEQPESSGPQIEQIMPRVNRMTGGILALALGILALGFVLLYRASPAGAPKELNERGRH